MAKSKKTNENEEVIESPVEGLSSQGVAVYKPGMHPRELRSAAEAKAKEEAANAEGEEAPAETPEEEAEE